MQDDGMNKAKLIGINHLALEVGDLAEALQLYENLFSFEYRSKGSRMAFLDMGDQFIAVIGGRTQPKDDERHFGLVVDDVSAVEAALRETGTDFQRSPKAGLDFWDPWGNHFQIVDYREIQFERTDGVKQKLGVSGLEKGEQARRELAARDLGES
jgi:catechol 2,3-dioxygenase-like lactoylglutathione lyase family enzyme